MEEGGFEPPKAVPADLQSVPFGHSGIPPQANDRTRTDNLLITSQLLCQLSHVGASLVSSKRRENGHYRARTYDILLVRQALSQLS